MCVCVYPEKGRLWTQIMGKGIFKVKKKVSFTKFLENNAPYEKIKDQHNFDQSSIATRPLKLSLESQPKSRQCLW